MNTLRVILTAFVIAGTTACGQTGPLYLPDKPRPVSSPATDTDLPQSSPRQP